MPTKAELQAELDALKAAQATAEPAEDPRIAQAVELGIPREVAVAQFAGDKVAQNAEPTSAPKFHATFLRNGKPNRVLYAEDGRYIVGASVGSDGKVMRARKFPIGMLAALTDSQWKQLRKVAQDCAAREDCHTFEMGDVFTG
jgi:hypothetical protein